MSSTRPTDGKFLGTIVLGGLLLIAEASRASPRRWDPGYTPRYPVVRVVSCPNQFARFPQPWTRIKSHLTTALNHWFVDTGIGVRLRPGPDLPSTDGRCLDNYSDPQIGEILFTAERSDSQGAENLLGFTRWWTDGTKVLRARVVVFRGVVANGVYRDWDWPTNADFPGPTQPDFGGLITHEIGHALGLDHTTDPTAVMYQYVLPGTVAQRMPSLSDQNAFLSSPAPYPRATTVPSFAFGSSNGTSWTQGAFAPVGNASVRGIPSACRWGTGAAPYLLANTLFSTQLMTVRYAVAPDATSGLRASWNTLVTHNETSYFGPSLACASASQMFAFVANDSNQSIKVKVSHDAGATWGAATPVQWFLAGTLKTASAGNSPALAYLPAASRYVLAWLDRLGGVSVFSTSNEGTTWTVHQLPVQLRSTEPMSLACSPTGSDCSLVLSDASTASLALTEFRFTLTSAGALSSLGTRSVLADTLGVGASWASGAGLQWAWPDRSGIGAMKATHLAAGGGTLGAVATSALHLQTPPALAWDSSTSTWHAWQSFSTDYDTEVDCSCPVDPAYGIYACHSGTCSLTCNANAEMCGGHCASNNPPSTSTPGQCSADCDCGLASFGYFCSLPTGQCIAPVQVLNRSFTFSQVIPYNGAQSGSGLPPVTGGSFVDVPASASSFTVPTSGPVRFAFAFLYDPGSGPSTSFRTGGTQNRLSSRTSSGILGHCSGIIAGPPQMALQLRLVVDGVPDTSYLNFQTFAAGSRVFAINKMLSAGSHTVAVQAMQVYQCGNATPDGTLSGAPSTFTGLLSR